MRPKNFCACILKSQAVGAELLTAQQCSVGEPEAELATAIAADQIWLRLDAARFAVTVRR
jgi:hypothetical protein